MKSFHFDCGDSYLGPVGFCARIKAETPEEAIETLDRVLDEQLRGQYDIPVYKEPNVEYITIYFGNIDEKMIDVEDDI